MSNMEHVITEAIGEILRSNQNELEKEQELFQLMQSVFLEMLENYLKTYDNSQTTSMRAQGYTEAYQQNRTLSFLLGDFTYSRKVWRTSNGELVKPVDELLGEEKYARYSRLTTLTIAKVACLTPYRSVEKIFQSLCGITVGKDTIAKATHEVGNLIKEYEVYQLAYAYQEKGTRQVKRLMIEADGVMIPHIKKERGKELLHILIHEGTARNGKRTELIKPKEFIGESKKKVKELAMAYLYETYDLKDTILISNSDNGAGVKETFFQAFAVHAKAHIHVLDEWHFLDMITRNTSYCKEMRSLIQRAIYKYDRTLLNTVLDTMESLTQGNTQEKAFSDLKGYLTSNWSYMASVEKRLAQLGLDCHKKELGLGSIESTHRKITFREKKRGMHWGKGGEYIAKIIVAERQEELEEIFAGQWRKEKEWLERPLAPEGIRQQLKGNQTTDKAYENPQKIPLKPSAQNEKQDIQKLLE